MTAPSIESCWREYRRREAELETRPEVDDDLTDEDGEWLLEPILNALTMTPSTERDWAAFTLVGMYFRGATDVALQERAAKIVERFLGEDIGIAPALQ